MNKMIRAAQVGEGDTEDYARAMKGLFQQAKPAGISIDELAGALAATAQQSKSVSEAETQIKSFIRSIISPSNEAREALKKLSDGHLSYEDLQKGLKNEGVASVVGTLQTLTNMDPAKIARLFPREEAQQFFNTADPKVIKELTEEVRKGTTAIPKAFAEGSDTIERQFSKTREQLKNIAADIGQTLKPKFKEINKLVGKFVGWFKTLGPEAKKLIVSSLRWGH